MPEILKDVFVCQMDFNVGLPMIRGLNNEKQRPQQFGETMTYRTKHKGITKGLFSFGNSKQPRTTAIFNMTSAHDCPSYKLGYCQVPMGLNKHKCYAKQIERMFKKVLDFRRRQAQWWSQLIYPEDFVNDLMFCNQKIKALRFNEAGDFTKQDDVKFAEAIAEILLTYYSVKTYCYTARQDLDFTDCKHLVILGSGFWKPGLRGEFRLINKDDPIPDGYKICSMDCRKCDRCLRGKSSVVYLH